MEKEINLKHFLTRLEHDQRVLPTDIKVLQVQEGVETIVQDIKHMIETEDEMFKLNIINTGSYYDEAKVGEPDEFDYLAELEPLSHNDQVLFEPTGDPLFMQIKVKDKPLEREWMTCLSVRNKVKMGRDESMSHVDDRYIAQVSADDKDLILDPVKMQKRFRQNVNKALKKITLPPGWEHGGFLGPKCSGIRRHGPAALIQLVYKATTDTYRINVDFTLGIALPLPVPHEMIKMNVFERIPKESVIRDDIEHCLKNGPCLHAIPLYSKLLIFKGSFENKISWRLSCSGIEKYIFDKYPSDSGVKICMRMIKATRDLFLSSGQETTRYSTRRPEGKWSVSKKGKQKSYTQLKQATRGTKALSKPEENPVDREEDRSRNLKRGPPYLVVKSPSNLSDDKSIKEMQVKDISKLDKAQRRGEYYGPVAYIPSIEIKTFIMNLISLFPCETHWTTDRICQFTMDFFEYYHKLLLERRGIKHYFFNITVSSPCTKDHRCIAQGKYGNMIEIIRQIRLGILDYENAKVAVVEFEKEMKSYGRNCFAYADAHKDLCNYDYKHYKFPRCGDKINICTMINDFVADIPERYEKEPSRTTRRARFKEGIPYVS